jgi:tryptophan synthase alpha chain
MAMLGTDRLAARLRASGDVKLVPYLMAGFPDCRASVELGRLYARAGVGAIEVGIPFSDPLADGPVIQRAGKQALEGGMTVAGALDVADEVAAEGTPVVLMTYLNPVLAYGVPRFATDAAAAGVAAVIVPDLPVEESAGVVEPLHELGVETVFLVGPASSEERLARTCKESRGFVYCVTVTGVTGARRELDPGLQELLDRVRAHCRLPVAAGFGISRPDHIRALRGHADAAVVASALLGEIQAGRDPEPLLQELIQACR